MSGDTYSYDPQLGYMPAIPEPFHGRLKWWHLRTHFVCTGCWRGFRTNSAYTAHYALNHIAPVAAEPEA